MSALGPRPSRPHAGETPALPIADAPLALPDKPSLAVLPFQNMSGDPEQEYFADGIVEDITTAIARLPWLFVIARNSSFTYKGKSVDVKQVGRDLGVRYVLEGSVRKAGSRVRITGQLIDTTTGAHIWADRFDGALDDIFDLQDQVASSVAGAIEPQAAASRDRAGGAQADREPRRLRSLSAGGGANPQIYRRGHGRSRALAKRALALDPSYAPAAAMVGWCRIFQRVQGWGAASDAEVAEALRLARQAVEVGRDDPEALWMAGYTIDILAGDHSAATGAIDRALALNPNSALAWSARGFVLGCAEPVHPGDRGAQQAMRLSPLDPLAWFFTAGSPSLIWPRGDTRKPSNGPIGHCRRSRATSSRCGSSWSAWRISAVPTRLANCSNACSIFNPGLTIAGWKASYATTPVFIPELLALCVEGLRKAGVPEE